MSERAIVALILALSRLPERARFAFICHTLHGRTYREIGEALGCSHERARLHAEDGRRRLAAELVLLRDELVEGLAA